MDETRSAWRDAGDQLSGLGRRFKEHYREQHGEERRTAEAVRQLAEAVQDTFEAMGSAAKDPEVKAEVKQVGLSLSHALQTTFADVSDELRAAFGSGTGRDTPEGSTPTEASADSDAKSGTEPDESSDEGQDKGPDENPPRVEPWGTP